MYKKLTLSHHDEEAIFNLVETSLFKVILALTSNFEPKIQKLLWFYYGPRI